MFLYNILTGGSSKQELPKLDKISFKINLNDNIPQYHEMSSSQTVKPYQYEEQDQVTQNHPMFSKIFKEKNTPKVRKNSISNKQSFHSEMKQKQENLRQSNKENQANTENDDEVVDEYYSIKSDKEVDVQNRENEQGEGQFEQIDEQYHVYRTTQNDTLFGIALKLDIRQQEIQSINGIGESLYPGMTIKLPKHCDISKLYEVPQEQNTKVKISELLGSQSGVNIQTDKYDVQYYAGLAGYIKGTLSINNNYIIFNPDLEDKNNLQNYSIEKLLKFNAIVETLDIQNVQYIDIPTMPQNDSNTPQHNFILQIFLYIVGNPKIQKKYKQRLVKLKSQKKAIASISFTLRNYKQQAQLKAQLIVTRIKQILQKLQKQTSQQKKQKSSKSKDQKHLTNIPFFDIIHENLHPKIKQQMESIVFSPQKQTPKTAEEPVSPSLVCGILTEPSDIISDNQFHNLSFSLPLLYQQCNWTRIYSSTVNGSSFTTFLNKAQGQYPLILLVKEYKGWILGAYICESLETGKTGRGEMFLFNYKNESEVPDIFKWTTKNEFFVYIEKESGIGIGMGIKYGLFLRNTLDKGSSAATFTFGNSESLSKKQDFTIEQVELWTVDSGY